MRKTLTREEFLERSYKQYKKGTFEYDFSLFKGLDSYVIFKHVESGVSYRQLGHSHLKGKINPLVKEYYYANNIIPHKRVQVEKIIEDKKLNLHFVQFKKRGLKLILKGKYGKYEVYTKHFLKGISPTIRTAIDKTEYLKNWLKDIHGDKYDYSLVEYVNDRTKIKIICPEHGIKEVEIRTVVRAGNGCIDCHREDYENPTGWQYKKWIKRGNKSKNFDSFKVYFIECTCENTGERFYKIGKTFLKVFGGRGAEARFPKTPTKDFPYKGKLLHVIEDEDGRKICDLENQYQKLNKENKYVPQKKFGGMYECFSKIQI